MRHITFRLNESESCLLRGAIKTYAEQTWGDSDPSAEELQQECAALLERLEMAVRRSKVTC